MVLHQKLQILPAEESHAEARRPQDIGSSCSSSILDLLGPDMSKYVQI